MTEPDDNLAGGAAERRRAARERLAARHQEREAATDADAAAIAKGADDADLVVVEAKYCIGCGQDLSDLPPELTQCPRCGRGFEPDDPSSYMDQPPPPERSFWLQRPRIAGYLLIGLYLLGRLIVGATASGFGGRFGEVVLAFAVLALLPWMFICVFLALEAIEEYHGPTLLVSILLGAGFGVLITVGMHPALMFCGIVVGGFTGMFRAWREI